MNYQTLHFQVSNHIGILTISRPKKLNALNTETLAEIHSCLTELKEKAEIRCLIVTGEGEKAFVAGADISEFASFSKEQGEALSRTGHHTVFDLLESMPFPVIAAVNGFALGGGLELAMSAHIRLFSDNAKVGLPEVTLGVIPGYGGTQRLARLVGRGKATEMICTGKMISAQEALQVGLANQVVAQDELLEVAKKMASAITRNSPMAISKALECVAASEDKALDGYEKEILAFGSCFGTKEFIEGTTAFLEKRKPSF